MLWSTFRLQIRVLEKMHFSHRTEDDEEEVREWMESLTYKLRKTPHSAPP